MGLLPEDGSMLILSRHGNGKSWRVDMPRWEWLAVASGVSAAFGLRYPVDPCFAQSIELTYRYSIFSSHVVAVTEQLAHDCHS
jgi:hypothetical protein